MHKENSIDLSWPVCPDQLTPAQKAHYKQDGFLAFEQALTPSEIEASCKALRQIIEDHAFKEDRARYRPPSGKNTNQAGASFSSKSSEMFFQLESGFTPSPEDLDELENKVRKFMWFENEAEIFKHICFTHPKIQGILNDLIGQDPVMYQSMALVKPAFHGSEKPWHQDNAYFSTEDLDGVVGTWTALDDATIENGCMHFQKGGHKLGPLKHHHTSDCEISSRRFDPLEVVPVPLKAGGIVFFHGNAPHKTPENHSPQRRRALQFHFRSKTNSTIEKEAYNRIFIEKDGTPASCAAAVPENF